MASLLLGRLGAYFALSLAAAAAVAARALDGRSNFYAAMVALARSHGAVVVFGNLGIVQAMVAARLGHYVFFGRLRPAEEDRLSGHLWYSVFESLVAAAIFRREFDLVFAVLFGFVIFIKTFHWLIEERIEYMEQVDTLPRFFHVRMVAIQLVLLHIDTGLLLLLTAPTRTLSEDRLCMLAMYAVDVSVLLATLLANTGKYVLNLLERRWGVWERKSTCLFIIDLVLDSVKMAVYINFLTLTLPRIPLYLLRDIYLTARAITFKIRDTTRYRAATRNMDGRYPTATPEELEELSDGICIICRDDLNPVQEGQTAIIGDDGLNYTPKKLPCRHIFHYHCLRSWMERQQTCPTCRRTVFQSAPQGAADDGAGPAPAPAGPAPAGPAPAGPAAPAPTAPAVLDAQAPTPAHADAAPAHAPIPATGPAARPAAAPHTTASLTLAGRSAGQPDSAAQHSPLLVRDREDMRRLLDELFPVHTANDEVGWNRVSAPLPPQYGPSIRLPTEAEALRPTHFPTRLRVVRADELPPLSTHEASSIPPDFPVQWARPATEDQIPEGYAGADAAGSTSFAERSGASDEDAEVDPREMARRAALRRAEKQRPHSGVGTALHGLPHAPHTVQDKSAGSRQAENSSAPISLLPGMVHQANADPDSQLSIGGAENELTQLHQESGTAASEEETETEYTRILRSVAQAEQHVEDLRRQLGKVAPSIAEDGRHQVHQPAGTEADDAGRPHQLD